MAFEFAQGAKRGGGREYTPPVTEAA
jgi:hypothetical protein